MYIFYPKFDVLYTRLGLAFVLLVSLFFATTSKAQSQNVFHVDTWFDHSDLLMGDGQCATIYGECTLRAAIEEANALPNGVSPDSISFEQVPLLGGLAVILLEELYEITDAVIIDGTTTTGEVILDGSNLVEADWR